MKHVRKLGLLAMAVAAMTAFAATASADELTSPEGTQYKGELTGESEGGHVKLVGPLGINVQCSGHIAGIITSQGPGQKIKGEVTSYKLSGCTNGYNVTVPAYGTIEGNAINGGPNATLRSTGATVTVHTPLGFNCEYTTNNTTIATATGSVSTGSTATLDISATVPRTGHSALCGANGSLTGSGLVTKPDFLTGIEN